MEKHETDNEFMDWKKLISDLQASGMTQKEIGAAIGKSQIWVSDVFRGRYDDLKWGNGETLRRLHAKRLQKAAEGCECREEAA